MPPKGVELLRKARCTECPLREALAKTGEYRPVPADINDTDTILVVDSPDKQATMLQRPMVGEFGAKVHEQLHKLKRERAEFSWTHVVACRYPKDRPEEFLGRLQRANKLRAKRGEPVKPTPAEACRPRFEAELALHKNVITFGSTALKAVGVDPVLRVSNPTLRDFRGFPTVTPRGHRLVATAGPTKMGQLEGKWAPIMRLDIEKAFRHFAGELRWTPPRKLFRPTPAQLEHFYRTAKERRRPIVSDVETAPYAVDEKGVSLYDPLLDPLRCLGFLAGDVALVIPLMSVDGTQVYKRRDGSLLFHGYDRADYAAIVDISKRILTDPDVAKIGHNFRMYDRQVLEAHWGVTPFPVLDTHPLHKLGDSEYPHSLSFSASIHTDAPPWKAEHTASEAQSDEELFDYNANDLKVNAEIAAPLKKRAIAREQYDLLPRYMDLQDVCAGMHRLGLYVDEDRRLQHEVRLDAEITRWTRVLIEGAEDQGFNPNSVQQVGRLLFDRWQLPVQEYTNSGDASTNDASIRALLGNPLVEPEQKQWLNALRRWRKAETMLSYFVRKWRRGGPFVGADGWIRPDYNAAGTVGWRFSSSNPNFQNVPNEYLVDFAPDGRIAARWNLRDIFVAPAGMMFVAADMDQLELRLAAALAEAPYYIDAFEKGEIDSHNLSGQMVFGPAYWEQEGAPSDPREKGEGAFKRRRDLIKRFVYAAIYGARANTIHGVITEAEDSAGNLTFADLTVAEMRRIHRRWMKAAPEFGEWWDRTIKEYRSQGYLADPVWGLRRYFANGEEFNEIVNYKVQAGGGAIVHKGMFALVKGKNAPLPFRFNDRNPARSSGLCLQVHDSLMFVVPEDEAERTKELVTENLTRRVAGLNVTFTAEAKIAKRWSKT